MELIGRVKKIFETQSFASGFQKRELVITTQENYPQDIIIEFLQDKISLLDSLKPEEEIKVSINIRGREWTNPQGEVKYFNSITGWRVEKISSESTPNTSDLPPAPPTVSDFPEEVKSYQEEEDDLPF